MANNMDKKETILKNLETTLELRHRPAMNLQELKLLFRKTCINSLPAEKDGKPMNYRRADLSAWAKEACENGQSVFYTTPIDPKNPNGKLKLCEPEYRYTPIRGLFPEEYNLLFPNHT